MGFYMCTKITVFRNIYPSSFYKGGMLSFTFSLIQSGINV